MSSEESERVVHRLCPHWWTDNIRAGDFGTEPIMYDVVGREKCVICGKRRVKVRVPEPHPTRDKSDLVEKLQQPGWEVDVVEWLPYEARGPSGSDSE